MDLEKLEFLLNEGQRFTIEFKERFSSKFDKDIVAFANALVRPNEKIADMFYRVDRAERIDSGIHQIMDFLAGADFEKHIIESNSFFSIIFERDSIFKMSSFAGEVSKVIKDELSVRQKKILKILQNKKLSPSEILDVLKENISDKDFRQNLHA